VTRAKFVKAVAAGTAEECVNKISVAAGDSILVRSGQVHAIDAGNLILEIQQNSDTTYRLYDWGRVGLDGRPRTLHVDESLRSILWEGGPPDLVQGRADLGHDRVLRRVLHQEGRPRKGREAALPAGGAAEDPERRGRRRHADRPGARKVARDGRQRAPSLVGGPRVRGAGALDPPRHGGLRLSGLARTGLFVAGFLALAALAWMVFLPAIIDRELGGHGL
jgi:hypothetical protein